MKLKEDQQRLKDLLKDTITLLCKNGLQFKDEFCVEALIGITLDQDNVFLVNIKETILSDTKTDQRSDSETETNAATNKEKRVGTSKSPPKAMKRRSSSEVFHDSPLKHGRLHDSSKIEQEDDSTQDSDCIIQIKTEIEDTGEVLGQCISDFNDEKELYPVPVGVAMENQFGHYANTHAAGLNSTVSLPSANESTAGIPTAYRRTGVPNSSLQSVTGGNLPVCPFYNFYA